MQQKEKEQPSKKKSLWRTVLCFALELAVLWIIFYYLIFFAYIPSSSMVPTLPEGGVTVASYLHGDKTVERGDVVIFWSQEYGKKLVKRVIGLPGETVTIEDGVVSVDGTVLEEPYVIHADQRSDTFTVPEDCYLFLGDNRENSEDARFWVDPYIHTEDLLGVVRVVVWPLTQISIVE